MFSLFVLADDSDNDGLEDAWEGANFGNLLQTANGDPDLDQLTNILEQSLGSDPNLNDTDADGYTDGVEYRYGTSPVSETSFPIKSLINITLIEPSFGVSAVSPFNLVIKTLNKSDCKYSTDPSKKYNEIDNSAQFFSTTDNLIHTKSNFPAASYIETPIYVFCKTKTGYVNDGFPTHFSVGVDNTEPVMLAAYANPPRVIENLEVDLTAETDDDTACRFFSYDTNISEIDKIFDNVIISEFSKKTILKLTKTTNPKIEDKKSYLYIAACMNKAENIVMKEIAFSVDLSVGNEINETFPSGFISKSFTDVRVVTNKDSTCYYGENYINKFPQENQKIHFIQKSNLTSGNYQYPVRCRFADATIAETTITFIVDVTIPKIEKLEVETEECNNSKLFLDYFATDENKIALYYIELIDSSGNIIFNKTTQLEKLNITGLDLSSDKKYYVELTATDYAGKNASKKSSEITVMSQDEVTCKNIPPKLEIKKSELTESLVKIYLECSDVDGRCLPINYHVINDSCTTCGSCDYIKYNPLLPIVIDKASEICYNISDDKKANIKNSFEIKFETCDQKTEDNCCNDRKAFLCMIPSNCTTITAPGCDLTKIDSDGDGISDIKEEECGLDPNNAEDADKDPDNDELSNKEECNYGTDMNNEDSDDDGYTDKFEIDENTDPNDEDDYPIDKDTDTDDDGLPDVFEKKYTFLNPKDKSDAKKDEDSDGLTNFEEYELGTDLDDSDSDGDTFTDYEEYKKNTDPNDKEDYPRNYVFQILFFILGIGALGGGLMLLYKNPIKSMKSPIKSMKSLGSSSKSMVDFNAAKNNMAQGMSVQPPQDMMPQQTQRIQKPLIDKSNLDYEIRKQKDIMKLRGMSSVFDQFAEDSNKLVEERTKSEDKPESREEKKQRKMLDRLDDISEEDAFEEMERIGKKKRN